MSKAPPTAAPAKAETPLIRLPHVARTDAAARAEDNTLLQMQITEMRQRVAQLEAASQLTRLLTRFQSTLYPNKESTANLPAFWTAVGKAKGWKQHLSPQQLELLLSEEHRWEFCLPGQLRRSVGQGFVELILSRLPQLRVCTLDDLRSSPEAALLQEVEHPFPKLQTMSMQRSGCDDAFVMELAKRVPTLTSLDVRHCRGVTWEGLEAARKARVATAGAAALSIVPASVSEKAEEDAQIDKEARWADHDSDECQAEYYRLMSMYSKQVNKAASEDDVEEASAGLWELWKRLGGKAGWRDQISPAQMRLLLSKANVQKLLYSFKPRDGIQINSQPYDAVIVEPEESTEFFTQLISRLPGLKMLVVYESPVDLLNLDALEQMDEPFADTTLIALRCSPCQSSYLIRLCQILPTLGDDGVRVDVENVIFEGLSRTELKERCGGTLTLL